MTTMARCYLREAVSSYGIDRAQVLCEGMQHYTGALMEVVNSAHPKDLPMVLAAIDVVEETVRDLPEYRTMRHAKTSEGWCRQLKPVIEHVKIGVAAAEPEEQ